MDAEVVVAALKEWIAEQAEIPETPDETLKLFVNLADGDLDTCKQKLFNYYSLRIFMVPKRTPEGYRVLISHAVNTDTKLYDMMGHMKYFLMTLESSLVEEELSPGYIVIFDISTLTRGHILKFSPSGIKKTSTYLQEGIPLKICNVYLVNASPLVDIMMKTAKPFLNMDLLKRTFIYKAVDIDKLYEKVPKECLPEEYGGTLGLSTALNEVNTEKLRKLKEHFSREEEVLRSLKNNKVL